MLKYFPIDDFVKPICSTDLQKVMKKSCMNLFSYAFELFKEVEKMCDKKNLLSFKMIFVEALFLYLIIDLKLHL